MAIGESGLSMKLATEESCVVPVGMVVPFVPPATVETLVWMM